jgi:hypothetical protein
MKRFINAICAVGVLCLVLMSCHEDSNPVAEGGYEVAVSAHPDSIPNSGAVSTIHVIITDKITGYRVGGMGLHFYSDIGVITGTATSSAIEPTGTIPNVYFACQDTQGTATITVTVYDDGDYITTETTEVVVYQAGYELTFYADPDTIANTGETALIYAIVRDNVSGAQIGGLELHFGATIGTITPSGITSATDPTGVQPPLIFFSGEGVQGSSLLICRVYADEEEILSDTTRVFVYQPGVR